jgi:large subunit ribosomal protein L21
MEYAVIRTGGALFQASPGDKLVVPRLDAEEGQVIEFAEVLAVVRGDRRTVGQPLVEGAKVTATVLGHTMGSKVISFKMKRRKGYRKKSGVRRKLTELRVEKIQV